MRQRVLTMACVVMLVAAAGHVRAGIYLAEHAHTFASAGAVWRIDGLDEESYSDVAEHDEAFYATSGAATVGAYYSGASATATAGGAVLSPNALARAAASAHSIGNAQTSAPNWSAASASASAKWSDEVIMLNPTETSRLLSLTFRVSGTVKVVEGPASAGAANGDASIGVRFQNERFSTAGSFVLDYQRYATGDVFTADALGYFEFFDTYRFWEINWLMPGFEYRFEGEITGNLLIYNQPQLTGDDRLVGFFDATLGAGASNDGGESIADATQTLQLVSIRDAATGEDMSDVVFLGSGMAIPVVVPEPSSLAFLGIGAVGIAVSRRRKRAA